MKTWINQRSNQITVFLVGIIIILIFNFILPAYEKLPYFNQKINELSSKQRQLQKSVLHLPFHQQKIKTIKKSTLEFQQLIDQSTNIRHLQNELGKLHRKHHIKIQTQKTDQQPFDDILDRTIIKMSLKGKYNNMISYFQDFNSSNNLYLLTGITIVNSNPLKKDALLLTNLEMQIFYPKK